MEAMKAVDQITEYVTPDISIIEFVVNNELLQGSLSTEELEDTTPLSGSWAS